MKLVYVIVLNYNGKKWLQKCFESLAATTYENYKVLFIDNASADGSVEFIKENFPTVRIIESGGNLGFCEGNAVGMRTAIEENADYMLLLNTDTKVESDWLTELVKAAEYDEQIGVLGAVQLVYDGDELNNFTKGGYREHLDEINSPARLSMPVKWVEGSCFMIRRRVIEEIGYLDPIYFMYCEEIDYCRRVAAHGYRIALVPRARYHHYGGGSSGRTSFKASWRYTRSNLIYHATDLNLPFRQNVSNYLKQSFQFVSKSLRKKRFLQAAARAANIVALQPVILLAAPRIIRKWKSDRKRLR